MYFGSNDIILHRPELRDYESCALDVIDTKLYAQDGLFVRNGDFSLQALLLMMKRLKKNEVDIDKEVIEYYSFTRLVLLQFVVNLLGIVHQE